MSSQGVAILKDDRDLVWVVFSGLQFAGNDLRFDVHFLSRDEPDEAPQPFLGGVGYREPVEGMRALLASLAGVVLGEVRAMRHDPVQDGLSLEIKTEGDGDDRSLQMVLWLDLTRTSRAMKAWGSRGRQQGGLRFHTTVERLEDFRSALDQLAFPAAEA